MIGRTVNASTMLEPVIRFERLGVVLNPDGSEREIEGVLNPAIMRDRDGTLLMLPRMVAAGNVSRIGLARGIAGAIRPTFEREGVSLQPQADYEIRSEPGGYGCEDARVTFIPVLDTYVMCYTAFGPRGARIALAVSSDAHTWQRLGLVRFAKNDLGDVYDVYYGRPTQRFRYRAFMSHFRTRLRSVCVPKFAFWCSSRLASPRNPSIWRGVARFMHGVAGKYGDKVFLGEH